MEMPRRRGKRAIAVRPGDTYDELTVVREEPSVHSGIWARRMVLCRCSCGQAATVRLEYLRSGHTQSCGCMRARRAAETKTTHGRTRTRLYRTWNGMKARCYNPSAKSYRHYGSQGVTVCEAWQTFEPFCAWALSHGYEAPLTIDRIDPFGNYDPGNCRWIPKAEQRYNRRDTVGVANG